MGHPEQEYLPLRRATQRKCGQGSHGITANGLKRPQDVDRRVTAGVAECETSCRTRPTTAAGAAALIHYIWAMSWLRMRATDMRRFKTVARLNGMTDAMANKVKPARHENYTPARVQTMRPGRFFV